MTPQQANDYSFLPAHPMPIVNQSPKIAPTAWAVVVIFLTGAALFGAFHVGRLTTKPVDQAAIDQAFKTGLTLGAICVHDPNMAACSPESLRAGGVL